ncbi:MAG: class I SAM-dependent methyltransferase [Planctomycetota bacterium]|nr:class I SAM-dependent methyltransferase [Planctomycetota bacterium]
MDCLRSFAEPGGSLRIRRLSWHSWWLRPSSFDAIVCRNALRLAPKQEWRNSFRRFHALLRPSGLLVLESLNVMGLMREVRDLLKETGFEWTEPFPVDPSERIMPVRPNATAKFATAYWPTG